ncbi:hypothetical protein [Haematobacter genomosp. 1]|uniref:Uncharacterized protein n=1 Tax=Haematobacter genomosp. 1 TaxID=366618 RepID=A0A212A9J0_9RHOB|nr:hypothetical protein [Haematobacter genomosp. 1]OWJ76645.1 hypothetical protein CDV49_14255 [Haematobacter genomosp. 1]
MSIQAPEVWSLPTPAQFLAEAEATVFQGGAVLALDPSIPPGLPTELARRFQNSHSTHRLQVGAGESPLARLADALGCDAAMKALVANPETVAIVEGSDLPPADQKVWQVFLQRFARERALAGDGLAILFLGSAIATADGFVQIAWSGRVRRIDAMIWAEFHVPSGRSALFQDLAVNLAAELCGWRLDLVADLVSQREEDILAPEGWLRRNADRGFGFEVNYGSRSFQCPVHLLALGLIKEIELRTWRAQLATLFPWIEEHRLRIIDRYRKFLRIDDHLLKLQVSEVENIELGALRYQLRAHLSRTELEHIEVLASMRNDLAHRKPVSPQSFIRALDLSDALR